MQESVNQASVQEVSQLWKDGECQIIDVREYPEYRSEHIRGARLVPLSAFERQSDEIDREKPVYLMCRSGNRAKQAADRLFAKGFTTVNVVEGGMAAWSDAGLPVVRTGSGHWSLERQVRFVAGLLVLAGVTLGFLLSPYFFLLSGFVGAGLTFAGATDWCGMGMLLARMPWNRTPSASAK